MGSRPPPAHLPHDLLARSVRWRGTSHLERLLGMCVPVDSLAFSDGVTEIQIRGLLETLRRLAKDAGDVPAPPADGATCINHSGSHFSRARWHGRHLIMMRILSLSILLHNRRSARGGGRAGGTGRASNVRGPGPQGGGPRDGPCAVGAASDLRSEGAHIAMCIRSKTSRLSS